MPYTSFGLCHAGREQAKRCAASDIWRSDTATFFCVCALFHADVASVGFLGALRFRIRSVNPES